MLRIETSDQVDLITSLMDRDTLYLVRSCATIHEGRSHTCAYICLPNYLDSHCFSYSFLTRTHRWFPYGNESDDVMWHRVRKYWPDTKVVDWLNTNPFDKRYKFTIRRKELKDECSRSPGTSSAK